MPLPFIIESVEAMREKFKHVFDKVWVAEWGMTDRPGLHREYLFDFDSGIRLLISNDRLVENKHSEHHLSASWEWNPPKSIEEMHAQVEAAYKLIGGTGKLRLIGWSQAAIPHWVIEYESTDNASAKRTGAETRTH